MDRALPSRTGRFAPLRTAPPRAGLEERFARRSRERGAESLENDPLITWDPVFCAFMPAGPIFGLFLFSSACAKKIFKKLCRIDEMITWGGQR